MRIQGPVGIQVPRSALPVRQEGVNFQGNLFKDTFSRSEKPVSVKAGSISQREAEEIVSILNSLTKFKAKGLGSGSFGKCNKVNVFGKHYAVKTPFKKADLDTYEKEVKALEKLQPYKEQFQHLVGFFEKNNRHYLVTEVVPGSPANFRQLYLSPEKGLPKFLDRLCFLDRQNIFHFDLQAKNILVENDTPVIIDFGLAEMGDGYISPEMLKYRPHDVTDNPFVPLKSNIESFMPFLTGDYLYAGESRGLEKRATTFYTEFLPMKAPICLERAEKYTDILEHSLLDFSNTSFMPLWEAKSQLEKAIQYEKCKASLFKNPSPTVIKVEIEKQKICNHLSNVGEIIRMNTFKKAYHALKEDLKELCVGPAVSAEERLYYQVSLQYVESLAQ